MLSNFCRILLAPSDSHLFRAMAHFLSGRSFKTIEDVEIGWREFFASKNKAWYHRRIELVAERLIQTIESSSLYFEE
jgi:uncharacterized protein YdaU (DUF1376 family)